MHEALAHLAPTHPEALIMKLCAAHHRCSRALFFFFLFPEADIFLQRCSRFSVLQWKEVQTSHVGGDYVVRI